MKKLTLLLAIASIFMACEPKDPNENNKPNPNDTTEHGTGAIL